MKERLGDFKIDGMTMRYTLFMPRLYNLCISLGFERKKIMPSHAFCSDENQGYPIILITKHFGVYPFSHGRIGGSIATNRHASHAKHGKDMVIIHAGHVGYDADTGKFGLYRRIQTLQDEKTADCSKIIAVTDRFLKEYTFAKNNIFLHREGDKYMMTIDNHLLKEEREEGIFLNLNKMLKHDKSGAYHPVMSLSTSKSFQLSNTFVKGLSDFPWESGRGRPIGNLLTKDMMHFKKAVCDEAEQQGHLEAGLLPYMSDIVTSHSPYLTGAIATTQIEFDRNFRSIVKSDDYKGKRLLFISGLNIDVSPKKDQIFPLTKFIPWAAYIQDAKGSCYTLEQDALAERLNGQRTENRDRINLEEVMGVMENVEEIMVKTA